MAVDRETNRMTERRGETMTEGAELEGDGFADRGTPRQSKSVTRHRTTPMQFAREIRDELRQVAWPTRPEMVNYSLVVFFTLVVMIGLIFLLNFAFGKGVLFLFQK
jgi:preprotein translocase subunit SecE